MTPRFKCPECGGEFDKPAEVSGKSLSISVGFVSYDADGCPWCGEPMSATARNPEQASLAEDET